MNNAIAIYEWLHPWEEQIEWEIWLEHEKYGTGE